MKNNKLALRIALVSAVSVHGLVGVAHAQTASTGVEDIIVTAQRQAQSLQDVPIAVSAFSAEALTEKQINNASQLQLTLPNITFSKGNFTGSSFTIRGVGDLCVGVSCDSATAIHLNDLPLFATRLFETEYFDLERVEVLRGPQGTLFGRNATSGVVNFVTGKPDPREFKASGEASYGNFNEFRVQGMVNVPLGENFAARAAGFYLKRDGYTENLYNGDHYDGRDMFALRGSLRWEPTPDTTVDVMGYWFKEDDNRMRIQKQMCQRDPTGVLGCLPGRREYGLTNTNSTFVGTLSSREFLRIQGGAALGPALSSVGLGSLYGPDANAGGLNPADPRKVYTDYAPTYKAEEIQIQAKIEHDFGPLKGKISGQFQENSVDSSQDYTLSVQNRSIFQPGINNLFGLATALPQFRPMLAAIFPNGPTGEICTSLAEETGTGSFGGHKYCSMTPQDFDRSNQYLKAWTVEGIVSSDFDGKFNFLLGAIYNRMDMKENSYYVNAFGIDYVSGILGAATALGNPALGNVYLATPFYRNNTQDLTLKSYGIFGEAYFDASDSLRFTVGLRYNNDQKSLKARSTLASFPSPFTMTNAFDSPFFGSFDADPSTPGVQPWAERDVKFSEFTGRFVVDYKITDDNLLYASYSRGYKSGGINPPLQPIFAVPDTFEPEFIDAFEIGSKNRFADGTIQLNATAFYYKYKALQLSRIVARTSVNDNVDANIWGLELEGIVNPIPPLTVNLSLSYLNTEVSSDKYLSDPFDPSGGRSDAVIVKDITNGANCAVVPTGAGGAALTNGYVTAVNTALGLRGPTAFPTDSGINGATGAFGICSVLAATATANGVAVLSPGVENNIKGNKLPQAPEFKVAGGVQWTQEFASGMTLVPRWDFAFTGESYGSIFNSARTRVPSYLVMNAQVQLNAANERWFVRGFVQNITNNSAITGLYSTDQSSGNFTNIFTLEPRRYGIAAGFKF
ncbi:MAG: TonB-dependent receptor [Sphingomonas sp.]|nr:MAG: TonB-dependent receptor [Sphingomonas sp.]